jgi:hypothetical protein
MNETYTQDDYDSAYKDAYDAAYAESFQQGYAEGLVEGRAAGLDEGEKASVAACRERCKAILEHANAQGRRATAMHLALATGLSAEEAIGVLSGVPKDASASSIREHQKGTVVSGPWVA